MKVSFLLFLVALICVDVLSATPPAQPDTRPFIELPENDLDKRKLGISAYVNDSTFGSISQQFQEVRETLGLRHVRILFNWDDNVQATRDTQPDFSFYDDIVDSLPRRTRALVILTALPSWVYDSTQRSSKSPRQLFSRRWIRKVIRRYRRKKKIVGFQIWNEPDDASNPDNVLLKFDSDPGEYLKLVKYAKRIRDRFATKKKIVSAATRSISENFPETLEYNEELVSLGLEDLVDVFAIHYYKERLETLLIPGGTLDFMQSIEKPIWITESGAKGVNEQKEYARRLWPYLLAQVPTLKRIYIYQFTEDSDYSSTYGLKNPSQQFPVSDLYIHLRDDF
jgi:hypothetical protein